MKNKRLLIVGGCGFIGTNLISLLNRQGIDQITVFDNESVGKRDHLDGLRISQFVHGDIRDPDAVDAVVRGHDAVVLLAAQTNVIKSIEDPEHDFDVNIRGGLGLLRAASRHKLDRFVFSSSAAPLGMQLPPMREDLAPLPAAPYGASKLAMEGYCSAFYHSYGLKTVTLRFSNCYGPGSRNKSSVIAHFMKRILAGQSLTIYGDGEQTRDYVFVDDLCQAILLALGEPCKRLPDDLIFGQVYQAATGTETSLNTLISLMTDLVSIDTDLKVVSQNEDARAGEIVRNFADPSKFKETFGYAPKVSLADGLKITWDYFLNEQSKS